MQSYNIQSVLRKGEAEFGRDTYILWQDEHGMQARTYTQFTADVYAFAAYLQAENLLGKRIGIYSENSYAYMVADIAIMGFVGQCVGMSKDWAQRDVQRAVSFLSLDALIYSAEKRTQVLHVQNQCPNLRLIDAAQVTGCPARMPQMGETDLDAPAKIIFSSGTTGMPKAVMLSQRNMFANFDALAKRAPMNHDDLCYLFLPLHHTYGGICNFLYSLVTGMQIFLCSDAKTMMQELATVKPSVFCAVPLVFERVYAACQAGNLRPSDVLGGNIRFLFSGGAFLNPDIRRFFKQDGLTFLESYGLSETASLVSTEYPNETDFHSVGTVYEGVDIVIDQPDADGIGEVLVRGENVFLGYCNDAALTARAFTEDGFFRTGDLGYLENRTLFITGRKKRQIILSNGENVSPEDLEALLCQQKSVQRARVMEKDGEIFALIFVDGAVCGEDIVEKVNQNLPSFSNIRTFEVVDVHDQTGLK